MTTVLIAMPESAFRHAVEAALEQDFQTVSCGCAEDAARLTWQHQPHALLLDLSLTDALYLLEHLHGLLPPVIVTVSTDYPAGLPRRLEDLGVSYCLLRSCNPQIAARHIRVFLEQRQNLLTPQDIIAMHLQLLGLPPCGGFHDLRLGVPLFAQDTSMPMGKVFYPAVASLRGRETWQQVEKAIRDAKRIAYNRRDDTVWRRYFPDTSRCPRNREFIARLAEFLK